MIEFSGKHDIVCGDNNNIVYRPFFLSLIFVQLCLTLFNSCILPGSASLRFCFPKTSFSCEFRAIEIDVWSEVNHFDLKRWQRPDCKNVCFDINTPPPLHRQKSGLNRYI